MKGEKNLRWGVAVIGLLAVLAFPFVWTVKGIMFAQHAAENGLQVEVPVKIDGFGLSARASQAALDKKMAFNDKLFEQITSGDYVRKTYGVDEGLTGFFFAIGTRMR